MLKLKNLVCIALCALVLPVMQAHAQVITQWTFDNTTAANNNTPAPATGSGSASAIGMTNTYGPAGSSSVNTDDVFTDQGTDATTGFNNTSASNQAWRIRGQPGTGADENGWNSAAPIGTQGAQFNVSTVGYSGISLTFDLDISTQGEGLLQVEYTTDGTNWINAPLTFSGTGATVKDNTSSTDGIVQGYYLDASLTSPSGTSNWFNQITATFANAGNDPNFAVRIVNAATGSADVALKASQDEINDTSGNWRLDDVTIDGEAIPEPGTYALMLGGLAFLALLVRFRATRLS